MPIGSKVSSSSADCKQTADQCDGECDRVDVDKKNPPDALGGFINAKLLALGDDEGNDG